jgi:hypothetical protein
MSQLIQPRCDRVNGSLRPELYRFRQVTRVFPVSPRPVARPPRSSAQRESNPHVRHGEAVGSRYIMGTCCRIRIVKDERAPGGTRTHVAALRARYLRRWMTGASVDRVGMVGFEPTVSCSQGRRIPRLSYIPRCEYDSISSYPCVDDDP